MPDRTAVDGDVGPQPALDGQRGDAGGSNGIDRALLADPSLDVVQRLLLATDGYVVRLLEVCYGEAVRTAERMQFSEALAPTERELEPDGDDTALRRTVLLQGARTGRVYLAAEATVMIDRVPAAVRAGLLDGDEPIGWLLQRHRVETFRELRRAGRVAAGRLASSFGLDAGDELLWRTYRMISGGRPITLITEHFPAHRPGPAAPA